MPYLRLIKHVIKSNGELYNSETVDRNVCNWANEKERVACL